MKLNSKSMELHCVFSAEFVVNNYIMQAFELAIGVLIQLVSFCGSHIVTSPELLEIKLE